MLSGGRLILGLGLGYRTKEFEPVGLDYHHRGALMDESLEVLAEFADLVEIEIPNGPWDEAAGTVIMAEAASAFEEFMASGDHLVAVGAFLPDYAHQACALRAGLAAIFGALV